jgi:hypothetical protein
MNAFSIHRTETIASLPPCSGYGGMRGGVLHGCPPLPNSQQRGQVIGPNTALWPSLEENDTNLTTSPRVIFSVVSLGRRAAKAAVLYGSRAFQLVLSLVGLSKPLGAQGLRFQSASYHS